LFISWYIKDFDSIKMLHGTTVKIKYLYLNLRKNKTRQLVSLIKCFTVRRCVFFKHSVEWCELTAELFCQYQYAGVLFGFYSQVNV